MQLYTTNSYNTHKNFLNWIILEHIKKHNTIEKYNQKIIISRVFPSTMMVFLKNLFSKDIFQVFPELSKI